MTISYPPLIERSKLIAIMVCFSIKARVEANVKLVFNIVRRNLPLVDKWIQTLSKSAESFKRSASYKLHDRFHVTKDKLDVYKEYLDVLSRQFMVQDGRSLDHVHVNH